MGLVTTKRRPGEAAVMVRFQGKVAHFRALLPQGLSVAETPSARKFIDTAALKQILQDYKDQFFAAPPGDASIPSSEKDKEPSDPPPVRAVPPTTLPGFPSRREMADRYAARTGRDLSKLDFYIGFNRWKTAAIVHGVYSRYLEGKKSTVGVDLEGLKRSILQALAQAEAAVERLEQRV